MTLIINTYWLGDVKPCLIYGLRGLGISASFLRDPQELSIWKLSCQDQSKTCTQVWTEGNSREIHGLILRNIHEPFHELSFLLSQISDGNGNILIPTFYDKVRQISSEESSLLDHVEFDMKQYQQYYGIQSLKANSVKDFLVRR